MPTDETVPNTFWVALPTVMITWLPALIWPTSEASTDACTSYEPVLTSSIPLAVVLPDDEDEDVEPWPVEPEPGTELPDPEPDPDPEPEPDPDPEPDPVPEDPTCWPTVYPTEVTVPANGAVIVAPARSAVAELTCPCATVIEAESAASCVLDAPAAWSAASFACALASVALAAATSLASEAESIAASRWPLLTFCPAVTQTAVTWPAAGKLRSSVSVASTVPDAETVCRRVPVVTVAVR